MQRQVKTGDDKKLMLLSQKQQDMYFAYTIDVVRRNYRTLNEMLRTAKKDEEPGSPNKAVSPRVRGDW